MKINIVKKYNSACIFYNFKFQYEILIFLAYFIDIDINLLIIDPIKMNYN